MYSIYLTVYGPLLISVILGIIVYRTNQERVLNQCFLVLSVVIGLWLTCLYFAFYAAEIENLVMAEFYIRQSSAIGVFIPIGFELLRHSIKYTADGFLQILKRCRIWLVFCVGVAAMCETPLYINGVVMPSDVGAGPLLAEPIYGPGLAVFFLYFLITLMILVYRFTVDARKATGVSQVELHFIMLGGASGLVVGITFAVAIPFLVTGSSQSIRYAPLSVIVLDSVIAYGIATRRILDVAYFVRTAVAYSLVACYLLVIYALVWNAASYITVNVFLRDTAVVSHSLAALAVAFSLSPVHGVMQQFADRLFINVHSMDVGETLQQMNRILQSIGTLSELLANFGDTLAKSVGTDRVIILLQEKDVFTQRFPSEDVQGPGILLSADDPLVRRLSASRDPIVADELQRSRQAVEVILTRQKMADLTTKLALGIYSQQRLVGLLLMGPRLSGRIYSLTEQSVLQILCDQLSVALDNAQLFTQVQNSSIYHEILLDNLVNGVVAVDTDGQVTVFNREAQRICRAEASDVLTQDYERLPDALVRVIRGILRSHESIRDVDVIIHRGEGNEVPVRLGANPIQNNHGDIIGALIVFHDLSMIRKLEMQVRHNDRLASIGTLSTSMAHEIKNPLVAIKTFTQLLPERFDDEEFRESYETIMAGEVNRIDTIVTQLLTFSRPAPPTLEVIHLTKVVNDTLKIIEHRLGQAEVELHRSFDAVADVINADPNQLQQVFFNLFLNAAEAMQSGGMLSVSTALTSHNKQPEFWEARARDSHISVTISDTGSGIKPKHLTKIFDPFFTTKSNGTGMGLAVAFGILKENGGTVDVDSEYMKSTTFTIVFPLHSAEGTP